MPFQFPDLDPDRLRAAVGALLGAAVYGIYTVIQMLKSGQPLALADYLRVGMNLAAATASGVLAAVAIAPGIIGLIPWAGLRETADPVLIGFFIGAAGWESLPFVLERIKSLVRGTAQ